MWFSEIFPGSGPGYIPPFLFALFATLFSFLKVPGENLYSREDPLEVNAKKILAEQLFGKINEGVVLTNPDAVVLDVNPSFSRITGFMRNEVVGRHIRILKSNKHNPEFYQKMWKKLLEDHRWDGQLWNRRKNGEAYPERLTIQGIRDEDGQVYRYIGIFQDLSEQHRAQDQVNYQAHHDALTELPNQALFKDRLEMGIKHKGNDFVAILFLNVDRFKNINESLGPRTGDMVLWQLGDRLKNLVKRSDTVSRWGGDKFAFLIERLKTKDIVPAIALRLLEALKNPFKIAGKEIFLSASIGITIFPGDGKEASTLIRNAETAMYQAGKSGGNTLRLYTPEMNQRAFERLEIENNMRKAIENREFVLYYQPKVSLKTGLLDGMEALVRWENPKRGLISPGKFIPVAEETGLIVPLGYWVLREACAQFTAWKEEGLTPPIVSVNLSPRQFQEKDLVENIGRILEETGMSPSDLELEITESLLVENAITAIEKMNEIFAMGIALSIDDFGTGYSSLSYLTLFPISTLKVDRAFIKDLASHPQAGALVESIIGLGKSLKLKVLAEGVETIEQLDFLKVRGCQSVQGHLVSKPIPVPEFNAFLEPEKVFVDPA